MRALPDWSPQLESCGRSPHDSPPGFLTFATQCECPRQPCYGIMAPHSLPRRQHRLMFSRQAPTSDTVRSRCLFLGALSYPVPEEHDAPNNDFTSSSDRLSFNMHSLSFRAPLVHGSKCAGHPGLCSCQSRAHERALQTPFHSAPTELKLSCHASQPWLPCHFASACHGSWGGACPPVLVATHPPCFLFMTPTLDPAPKLQYHSK